MPRTMLLGVCLLFQGTSPAFHSIQPERFAAGGALVNAVADLDGDGDLDLFVGFNGAPNRLYRNDGGTFADVASEMGLADARPTRAAAWADMDADGDPDLLLGFAPGDGSVLRLYRNDGGRFVDVTAEATLRVDSAAVRQPAWVDIDNDGDLDLFVAFRDRPNALFRNENGRFRDIASLVGLADPRKSVGAVWFDFDEDGDLDLYVANMDGDPNGLYRNDDGRFTDVARSAGLPWGGRTPLDPTNGTVRPCVGDVNNDGHLDLVLANYGPNGLFLNRGAGTFEDASAEWGVAIDGRYDACALADIDNDGLLDLYVNGTVTGGVSYRDYLFRNAGTRFVDVTPSNIKALQADHGVAWLDTDRDGALDLALTGVRPDGMHSVLRNALAGPARARRLAVDLVATAGGPAPPGTELRFYDERSGRVLGTRMLDTGSGYNAQSLGPVHFGVPADVPRVRVDVIVPGAPRAVVVSRSIEMARVVDRVFRLVLP